MNIEGLGRELYPQLSLWDTAKPYLEKWHQDRYMPKNMLDQLRQYAPQWLEQLPQLPDKVFDNLNQGASLNRLLSQQQAQLNAVSGELKGRRVRKKRWLAGSLAVACGFVVSQPALLASMVAIPPLGIGLFVIGATLLLLP